MSVPSLTKRNPDPYYDWFLTGDLVVFFEATDQEATAPAKVIARPPFRASNGTANASSQDPITAPAAPTNSHNPFRCGQIP
jgi:hypothetical protein